MDDPTHPGQLLTFMTVETWRQYGTQMQQLLQTSRRQDERIKELLGENAVLVKRTADAESRLSAMRDIRRREKRAELEDGLILPGDTRLNQNRK
jgi:hypothetical protein